MEQNLKEILESISVYLDKLCQNMDMIVRAYRSNDIEKISTNAPVLLDGISWLTDALNTTKVAHDIDVTDTKFIYEELLEAMQNSDNVLTADIFEYEITPKFIEYKEKIDSVLKAN